MPFGHPSSASKWTIRCSCLGSVFNLATSKVTFVEDALMDGMALAALVA